MFRWVIRNKFMPSAGDWDIPGSYRRMVGYVVILLIKNNNSRIGNFASTLWMKYVCLIRWHFDVFPESFRSIFHPIFEIYAFIPPFGECLFNQPQNNANKFVYSWSMPVPFLFADEKTRSRWTLSEKYCTINFKLLFDVIHMNKATI